MAPLGKMLRERGWVTEAQVAAAQQRQKQLGGRLGTALLEIDALSEDLLLKVLSEQLGVPAADIEDLRELEPEIVSLLPAQLAVRAEAVPFRQAGGRVDVAMLDVRNIALQDELSFAIGKRLRIHIANEARIFAALHDYYGKKRSTRFEGLLRRLNRTRDSWKHPGFPGAESDSTGNGDGSPRPAPRKKVAVATEKRPVSAPPPQRPTSIPLTPQERRALQEPTAHAGGTEPPGSPRSAPGPGEVRGVLQRVEHALAEAESPREVGGIVLEELARRFVRAAVLRVRRGSVSGWLGHGPGFDPSRLQAFEVALDESSVFHEVARSGELFRGVLSPLPAHLRLLEAWQGHPGAECVVCPVSIRGRLICALYADRDSEGVDEVDLAAVLQLAARASVELERCILRSKLSRAGKIR